MTVYSHLMAENFSGEKEDKSVCCDKTIDELGENDWIVSDWGDAETAICPARKEDPGIVADGYNVDVLSPAPTNTTKENMTTTELPASIDPNADLTSIEEEIGPDEAAELLGGNTANRHLRFRVVDAYANDMKSGAWRRTGDPLKIASDGTIIDGQHRLHAIIASETTQKLFVVRGLDFDVQQVVDTGAKRTFADVLKLRKEVRCNTLASITRRVEIWSRGQRVLRGNVQPTNSQLLLTLDRHPEIRISTELADHVKQHVPITASILGLAHWLFGQVKADTPEEMEQLGQDVEDFFERLRDGDGLAANHPIAVLRRTAFDDRKGHSRLQEEVMIAYTIKAWNAYRQGRSITMLRFRPGGSSPEKFPEPV